jgi:hypothetical protein
MKNSSKARTKGSLEHAAIDELNRTTKDRRRIVEQILKRTASFLPKTQSCVS